MSLEIESASAPPPKVPFFSRPATVVTSITLFGLVLRLMFLSHPALWIDEAAAYRRISGSWPELIESIRDTGFTPLHYFLYWAISRYATMTPFMMRLPTAIAGAAMVPAVYWLARELASRPAAYLAALLTATSAYLLNYSRDAKMYVECWLMVTVNMACLLWWLRQNRWHAWLCWLITSLLMIGFHATATMIIAAQVILVIVYGKPQVKRSILFILGLAISLGAMVAYYKIFNRFYDKTKNAWGDTGLSWIQIFTNNQSTFELIRGNATNFLFAWEWPPSYERIRFSVSMLKLFKGVATTFFIIIGVGLIPWRKLPENQINWRAVLLLAVWLVIPVYATYCASISPRLSPWGWVELAMQSPYLIGAILIIIASQFFRISGKRNRWMNLLKVILLLLTILLINFIVYLIVPQQPSSVWRPRYVGVILPAMIVIVSVLLLRLPTRPIRGLVIYSLIGVNLFHHATLVFFGCEPPTGQIASDILTGQAKNVRTYISSYCTTREQFGPHDDFFTPTLPYYLYTQSGTPTTPSRYNYDWEEKFIVRIAHGPIIDYALADLRGNPDINEIIVWERPLEDQEDILHAQLGNWNLVNQNQYLSWDRWHWWKNNLYERRVYQRQ